MIENSFHDGILAGIDKLVKSGVKHTTMSVLAPTVCSPDSGRNNPDYEKILSNVIETQPVVASNWMNLGTEIDKNIETRGNLTREADYSHVNGFDLDRQTHVHLQGHKSALASK